MKKAKNVSIDTSRRRFMTYFSGTALGATLVPGVLWGKMQDAGAQSITLEMLTTALKVGGVEFTEEERKTMVATANQNLTRAAAIRKFHIPNDISPPFHINAIVPGVVVNKVPTAVCARQNSSAGQSSRQPGGRRLLADPQPARTAAHQAGVVGGSDQDVSRTAAQVQRAAPQHRHVSRRTRDDSGQSCRCRYRRWENEESPPRDSVGLQGHHQR